MNRSTALLMLALLFADSACAREVYRCRTPDGALRFGDTPCEADASDQSTVALRDPPPEQRRRDTLQAEARARAYADAESKRIAELDADATRRLPASLGGSAKPSARQAQAPRTASADPKRRACDGAKARRDKAYHEHGNDMNFDARRKLQDQMSAACGG